MTKNQAPPIEYSNCYVAFLDVLGFKKLVLSKGKREKKKIAEYFQLIRDVTAGLEQIKEKRNFGSIIISDSVILSVPAGDTNKNQIDNLRHLCVAVGKIQFALAQENIWIRGAISSGEAYFNSIENQVVGPAYIQAYLLEERQALHPRVILDNKIIKELQADSAQDLIEKINKKNQGGLNFTNWSKEILFSWQHLDFINKTLEKDVALFIDYLNPLFHGENIFPKIISNIEKTMYAGNEIYPKFRWVVDYLLSNTEFFINYGICEADKSKLNEYYNKLQKY